MTSSEHNAPKTPDIEIYIDQAKLTEITDWLNVIFDTLTKTHSNKKQHRYTATIGNVTIPILIIDRVEGNYSSVWFNSTHTPWINDKACALEAFRALHQEIRCIQGSWNKQEDPDLWWSINDQGEGPVIWKTQQ